MLNTTLSHGDKTYAAEMATIRRTELGREDHGIFHAMLHVDFASGGSTGIGGYALDDPLLRDNITDRSEYAGTIRRGTAYGLQWIIEAIYAVLGDFCTWEQLVGKRLFALYESDVETYNRAGMNCKGIASLDGNRIMIFSEVINHVEEK